MNRFFRLLSDIYPHAFRSQTKKRSRLRRQQSRFGFEHLEPRKMLSADMGVALAEAQPFTIAEFSSADATSPPVLGTIDGLEAPQLTNLVDRIFIENADFQFIVTAEDADTPREQLTFELLRAPQGATLDPNTGQFEWSIPESAGGFVFGIDVRVTDDTGLSDTQTFLLTVNEDNQFPVFTEVADQFLPRDEDFSFDVFASDSDQQLDPLVFSLLSGPIGATITPEGNIAWAPNDAQRSLEGRTVAFSVAVTDETGNQTVENFQLELQGTQEDAPELNNLIDRLFIEQSLFQFVVTSEDSDTPLEGRTYELLDGPEGATLDPQSGLFQFTATEAQAPFTFEIDVQVTDDAGLTDTGTFNLQINERNEAPVLETIAGQGGVLGEEIQFTAIASDPDLPANPLTFSLTGDVPTGAAIDPQTGLFTWTPTAPDIAAGVVVVNVTVSDGTALSDTQAVSITVSDSDFGTIPVGVDLVVSADDIVGELAAGSSVAAADITFTSATVNGSPVASLADVGFSFAPGTGSAGALTFATEDADAFVGLATDDTSVVDVAFTFPLNGETLPGFLRYTASGSVAPYDASVDFTESDPTLFPAALTDFVTDEVLLDIAIEGDVDVSESVSLLNFDTPTTATTGALDSELSVGVALADDVSLNGEAPNGAVVDLVDFPEIIDDDEEELPVPQRASTVDSDFGTIPVGVDLVVSADDIVSELVPGSSLTAADVTFTSATVNGLPAPSLGDVGFSFAPGTGSAGAITFATQGAAAFASLAAVDAALVEVAFSFTLDGQAETGVVSYTVSGSPEFYDATVEFLSPDDATEAMGMASAAADEALLDVEVLGDVDISQTVSVVNFGSPTQSIVAGIAESGLTIAAVFADDNSEASATASGNSIATGIATEDSTATAIASSESIAFASGRLQSTAQSAASDNSTSNTVAVQESMATAVADVNSAASGSAESGSDAGALAENGSASVADAITQGSAIATADNSSVATAVAQIGSTSIANSDMTGSTTAFATQQSTASADALDSSIANAFAEGLSSATASAADLSSAAATAEGLSSAAATADQMSDAQATATDNTVASAVATLEASAEAGSSD